MVRERVERGRPRECLSAPFISQMTTMRTSSISMGVMPLPLLRLWKSGILSVKTPGFGPTVYWNCSIMTVPASRPRMAACGHLHSARGTRARAKTTTIIGWRCEASFAARMPPADPATTTTGASTRARTVSARAARSADPTDADVIVTGA